MGGGCACIHTYTDTYFKKLARVWEVQNLQGGLASCRPTGQQTRQLESEGCPWQSSLGLKGRPVSAPFN